MPDSSCFLAGSVTKRSTELSQETLPGLKRTCIRGRCAVFEGLRYHRQVRESLAQGRSKPVQVAP